MFLLSPDAYQTVRNHVRTTSPQIACGVMGGMRQGSITKVVTLTNRSHTPSSEWQLDPQELITAVNHLMREGYLFQGIYLTHNGSQPAPTPEMLKHWRHNVPCFLVSQNGNNTLKFRAYTIDWLLQKASEIPVWIDRPSDEPDELVKLQPGAVLGYDVETHRDVVLSYEARRLSLYCIGATGMGKSTLLLNIIESDIDRGDGVGLIDPHGDFVEDILMRVPPHREQDVILWEVDNATAQFGLNLFACEDVKNPNAVDRVCSQIIGMFYKIYHTSWGPQMENLLRATFLTMIYNQDLPLAYRPTLVDVPRLWTDSSYRAYLTARVPHDPIRAFWEKVYNPLRPGAQLEFRLSSSNKIERFLENQILYNIFGQTATSVNFRRIMDEGRILLIKMPKGELGEDNTSLLGSVIIGQILEAVLSRVDTPFAERRPFHLIVDEYQNFATKTFITLQTEARKFAIDTIVSHQTRAMLDEESKGAAGAVGNIISFAATGEDAREMALMFDNTPPEPPVIGMKPVLTLSTNPWDHLAQHGHSSPQVEALVLAMREALITIPKSRLPNYNHSEVNPDSVMWYDTEQAFLRKRSPRNLAYYEVRKFVTEEDVRRFQVHLNYYLAERMKGVPNETLLDELATMQQWGPFYSRGTFTYLIRDYAPQPYLKVQVGITVDEYLVFEKEKAELLIKDQMSRQEKFYQHLEELAQLLAEDPILTNSGQYEEIRDRPRPFADVTNETANRLGSLKKHRALIKIMDSAGNRVQTLIATYPPSRLRSDAAERAERIRQASHAQYGLPWDEVGEKIRARGAAWDLLLRPTARAKESAKAAKEETDTNDKPAASESSILDTSHAPADHLPAATDPGDTLPPADQAATDEGEEFQ